MKAQHDQKVEQPTVSRSVSGRDVEKTAPLRCACYAALSELTASPHEIDPRPALREKIGVISQLEYAQALEELISVFVESDLDELKREYSGLFEVGSDGPPVPIREDLQTGQHGGTREQLVRFYNYFNYALDEKFAWAPDHLSVQLEFMHFLCFREASADEDALSYQLAQADFSQRHLLKWVPKLTASVAATMPESLYSSVVRLLDEFLRRDFEWQKSTISAGDEADG
jgi:DMSO reductase family type II enzyme chaperone